MKFPNMRSSNPPVTSARLSEFERAFGVTLPESYRQFLRQSNGGRPLQRVFQIRDLPSNPIGSVHYFLGVGSKLDVYDLEKTFRLLEGRIPEGILPIANTDGIDYICLDLREGENVVYWDHAHFWSTGEWREHDLFHIADSVSEFLEALKPDAN